MTAIQIGMGTIIAKSDAIKTRLGKNNA